MARIVPEIRGITDAAQLVSLSRYQGYGYVVDRFELDTLRKGGAMAKHELGERVIYREDGVTYRGKVTKVERGARRIVTDSGRRRIVNVRKLKASPDRFLILETRLDRSLKSRRAYAEMMKQWISAYGVEALHEKVHTIEDLRMFLRAEGRNPATRFIHIIGHGSTDCGQTTLSLTFETIDLVAQAEVFRDLHEKVILFSCCGIGASLQAMRAIKNASGAAAVIGYRTSVCDTYTNLAEALLYDRLIETPLQPAQAVDKVGQLLQKLGVKPSNEGTRKPAIVCV